MSEYLYMSDKGYENSEVTLSGIEICALLHAIHILNLTAEGDDEEACEILNAAFNRRTRRTV